MSVWFWPDFDYNQKAFAAQAEASAPSSYTVQNGDTLKGIAASVYGDSSLWYVIAQANGIGGDSELTDGLVLTIPSHIQNSNNADTFRPYNPGDIIGDTTPIALPPPPPKGCGVLAMVVMIVIAVVVTIFTAGAMAGVAGTAVMSGAAAAAGTITTAMSLGAAFVGGVVGSAASQLAGKAMGVVDHFSLRQAVGSGLTAAASAGIGQMLQGASSLQAVDDANKVKTYTDAAGNVAKQLSSAGKAVMAAGVSLSSVAANKIAGVKGTSFSWHNVVTSSAAAYAGSAMGLSDPDGAGKYMSGGIWQDTVGGIVHGALGYGIQKGLYNEGSWSFKNVAADAFGNAIGNSIVGKMNESSQADIDRARKQLADIPNYVVGGEGVENVQDRQTGKILGQIDASGQAVLADIERINGLANAANINLASQSRAASDAASLIALNALSQIQRTDIDQRTAVNAANRANAQARAARAYGMGEAYGRQMGHATTARVNAEIASNSFFINSEADLVNYVLTYDRSQEVASQAAFMNDVVSAGMLLTTLAAGGAAFSGLGVTNAAINTGRAAWTGARAWAGATANGIRSTFAMGYQAARTGESISGIYSATMAGGVANFHAWAGVSALGYGIGSAFVPGMEYMPGVDDAAQFVYKGGKLLLNHADDVIDFARLSDNAYTPGLSLNYTDAAGWRVSDKISLSNQADNVTGTQWNQYLSEKYGADNVTWEWPANRGFVYGADTTGPLVEGQYVVRYGPSNGSFVAPLGTDPAALSMAPGTNLNNFNIYRVTKTIPDVRMGPAAPAFDMPGYGMQYDLSPNRVNTLDDYLTLVPKKQ